MITAVQTCLYQQPNLSIKDEQTCLYQQPNLSIKDGQILYCRTDLLFKQIFIIIETMKLKSSYISAHVKILKSQNYCSTPFHNQQLATLSNSCNQPRGQQKKQPQPHSAARLTVAYKASSGLSCAAAIKAEALLSG